MKNSSFWSHGLAFVLGGVATFAVMAIQIHREAQEQAARAEREVAKAREEEQRAKDACEQARRRYQEVKTANVALETRYNAGEATAREVLETYAAAIRKDLKDH